MVQQTDETVELSVTQDDLARGRSADGYCCPVALAAGRQLFPSGEPLVTIDGVIYDARIGQRAASYWLGGDDLVHFIADIDFRKPVEPATFTLRLMPPRG